MVETFEKHYTASDISSPTTIGEYTFSKEGDKVRVESRWLSLTLIEEFWTYKNGNILVHFENAAGEEKYRLLLEGKLAPNDLDDISRDIYDGRYRITRDTLGDDVSLSVIRENNAQVAVRPNRWKGIKDINNDIAIVDVDGRYCSLVRLGNGYHNWGGCMHKSIEHVGDTVYKFRDSSNGTWDFIYYRKGPQYHFKSHIQELRGKRIVDVQLIDGRPQLLAIYCQGDDNPFLYNYYYEEMVADCCSMPEVDGDHIHVRGFYKGGDIEEDLVLDFMGNREGDDSSEQEVAIVKTLPVVEASPEETTTETEQHDSAQTAALNQQDLQEAIKLKAMYNFMLKQGFGKEETYKALCMLFPSLDKDLVNLTNAQVDYAELIDEIEKLEEKQANASRDYTELIDKIEKLEEMQAKASRMLAAKREEYKVHIIDDLVSLTCYTDDADVLLTNEDAEEEEDAMDETIADTTTDSMQDATTHNIVINGNAYYVSLDCPFRYSNFGTDKVYNGQGRTLYVKIGRDIMVFLDQGTINRLEKNRSTFIHLRGQGSDEHVPQTIGNNVNGNIVNQRRDNRRIYVFARKDDDTCTFYDEFLYKNHEMKYDQDENRDVIDFLFVSQVRFRKSSFRFIPR